MFRFTPDSTRVYPILAGCFLMVFGSLSAFFFSHKRIWVCLDDAGKKTTVSVAAIRVEMRRNETRKYEESREETNKER